jgi:hypothetical protein
MPYKFDLFQEKLKKENDTIINKILVKSNNFNLLGLFIAAPISALTNIYTFIASVVGLAYPTADGINKVIPISSLFASCLNIATSISQIFHNFVSEKTDSRSKYLFNLHPEYTFGRFASKCLQFINIIGVLSSSIASSVMSVIALTKDLTMNSDIMKAISWLNIGTFAFNILSNIILSIDQSIGKTKSFAELKNNVDYLDNIPNNFQQVIKNGSKKKEVGFFDYFMHAYHNISKFKLPKNLDIKEIPEYIEEKIYNEPISNAEKIQYLIDQSTLDDKNPNLAKGNDGTSIKDYVLNTDPFTPATNYQKSQWSDQFSLAENIWHVLSR